MSNALADVFVGRSPFMTLKAREVDAAGPARALPVSFALTTLFGTVGTVAARARRAAAGDPCARGEPAPRLHVLSHRVARVEGALTGPWRPPANGTPSPASRPQSKTEQQ